MEDHITKSTMCVVLGFLFCYAFFFVCLLELTTNNGKEKIKGPLQCSENCSEEQGKTASRSVKHADP